MGELWGAIASIVRGIIVVCRHPAWSVVRGLNYRYRELWPPFVILGFLAVARSLANGASPLGVGVACLLFSAITVFYLRKKADRAAEWAYMGTCLSGATLGLLFTSLLGTQNDLLNGLGVVGWAGLSTVWWYHHEVRGVDHVKSPFVALWNEHIRDGKGPMAGAELAGPVPFEHGETYTVRVVPYKQTLNKAINDLPNWTTALDTPMQYMVLEQHPDHPKSPRYLRLQRITDSPIEQTLYYDKPRHHKGIILLGPYADGVGEATYRLYTEYSMWGGFGVGGVGSGKALDVATPIATPHGWTTMGELHIGDTVFDETGSPTRIIATSQVMNNRPCYEVTFSDGSQVVADADHQWLTIQCKDRKATSRSRSHPAETVGTNDEIRWAEKALAETEPGMVVTIRELVDLTGSPNTRLCTIYPWLAGISPLGSTSPRRYDRADALRIVIAHLRRRKGANVRPTPAPVTTAQIASSLRHYNMVNHAVAVAAPLEIPTAELMIDPYVLGAWLGDGSSKASEITSADPEIIRNIEAAGWRCQQKGRYRFSILPQPKADLPRPRTVPTLCRSCGVPLVAGSRNRQRHKACEALLFLKGQLRAVGVFQNKHIPIQYMRGSVEQRQALLAGLLDTDGTVARAGQVQFTNTNHRLAEGVRDLACSLGYRAVIREHRTRLKGMDCGPAWTISFSTTDPVFRLERKLRALQESTINHCVPRNQYRYIVDAQLVESRPVRCIQVASSSSLYLAGKTLIPTHNSRLIDSIVIGALDMRNSGMPTVVFYADGQDGASSPSLFANATWAVGPDGSRKMLGAIERIIVRRNKENRAWGISGFTPSEDRPGILVIVDEAHEILPRDAKRWSRVARTGRKLGVAILAADQYTGLADVFGNEEPLRSSLLAGNGFGLRTTSRIAQHLIPGLNFDLYDLPILPGFGYAIAAKGSDARTAPFRGRFLPDEEYRLDHPEVPVATVEEWFRRYPPLELDKGAARAAGPDYTQRHETAEMERAELLRELNDDDALERELEALVETETDAELKSIEAQEEPVDELSATTATRIQALDWAVSPERAVAQVLTELPSGTKLDTARKALEKLVRDGELIKDKRGKLVVYRPSGTGD